MANEVEKIAYQEAAQQAAPTDDILLAYLVELDGSD
jgi:hypothetical protein